MKIFKNFKNIKNIYKNLNLDFQLKKNNKKIKNGIR